MPGQSSWYNLLYIPGELDFKFATTRATQMMLALRQWTVSLRLDGVDKEAVEAAVRVVTNRFQKEVPMLSAHMEAFQKGMPVVKYMQSSVVPGEPMDPDVEQTNKEIQAGRQQVLAPVAGVPSSQVIDVSKKPRTRGS